ncbi:MAG TPA: hypothetical protein VIO14_00295 [Dehalococcoidia bacterium]
MRRVGWRRPAALLLPAALALALNAATVTGTFQGDDFSFVVRHRQDGPEFLFQAFRELHIDVYYRPVIDLWLFAQQKAFDADPYGWHAVSVALHAATAAALALLVLALTRRALPAGLAGVLFALTPAYAGGVAWVANQTELLAGLLATLALTLLVTALRDRFRPALYAASVAVYGLALGSKEVAVAVLAPVCLYVLLRAGEAGWRPLRDPRPGPALRAAAPLLPFLAVTAAWGAAQAYVTLALEPPRLPYYHLGTHAVETVRYYALRLVLPTNRNATGWDALADVPEGLHSPVSYLALALVLGGALLALVRGSTASRTLAAWLLAALVPGSFWEAFFVSARWVYAPALPFAGLVALGAVRAAEALPWSRPRAAGALAAVVALLALPCAAGTWRQNALVNEMGEREMAFVRQLEALALAVPPGTTIYLVDTPWNGDFSYAESMAQMLYGPSVRVRQATAAELAGLPVGDGTGGETLVLGMADGRLAVLRPDASGASPPAEGAAVP